MFQRLSFVLIGALALGGCKSDLPPDDALQDSAGHASPNTVPEPGSGSTMFTTEEPGDAAPAAKAARPPDAGAPDTGVDPCAMDHEPPTVQVTPPSPIIIAAEGDGAAVLQIAFSEPVDGVEELLQAIDYVSSVERYESRYAVVVAGLGFGQKLQITLSPDVISDRCGNPLASEVVIDVAVQGDPCEADQQRPRLRSFPASPVTLAPGTTETTLQLLFNEPVEGLTGPSADNGATLELSGSGQEYMLEVGGLPAGVTSIALPDTVADGCGNTLPATTLVLEVPPPETTPPMVVSHMPESSATEVPATTLITLVFDEPMNRRTGTLTLRNQGTLIPALLSWSADDTTLTVAPRERLPLAATIDVELSGFEDEAGNALAANFGFSFTTSADPCAGLPYRVTLEQRSQLVTAEEGVAHVALELSAPFALNEGMLSLGADDGAGGRLEPGSLTGTGSSYSVALTGVETGDTYTVALSRSQSADGCSTLEQGTVPVKVHEALPGATGTCPLPPPLAVHVAADDACDEGTHHALNAAQDTFVTLRAPGDAFSLGGDYDADVINGQDTDYFAFEIAEDGAHTSDLHVVITYGCSFSGFGTRPAGAPVLELFDEGGRRLDRFVARDFYSDIDGSGHYGLGTGILSAAGATGANRYVLSIDDGAVNGTGFCVAYMAYVELIDNTRPGVCQPYELESHLDGAPRQVMRSEVTGQARVPLVFDQPFALTEDDIRVMPTSGGSGRLAAGTLDGRGTSFNMALAGVEAGETYDVFVDERAGTCGELQAGFLPVTVTDRVPGNLECPLPPPLSQHYALTDLCFSPPTNAALSDSAPTGFLLAEPGDRFSVSGTFDASDPAGNASSPDLYQFAIEEDGQHLTELELTMAYGCRFNGPGNPLIWVRTVSILDAAGATLATVNGIDTPKWAVDNPSKFAFGRGKIRLGRPQAGRNVYHLRFHGVGITQHCMDYIVYAELTRNDVDLACLGAGASSMLSRSLVVATTGGTETRIAIDLGSRFVLRESDLTLRSLRGSGQGSLVQGSLTGEGTRYSVALANAAVGDVYALSLPSRVDQCGTQLSAGEITVVVSDLPLTPATCPLPAAAAQHFPAPDICGQNTNSTVARSAVTGFTLAAVGDRFSLGGLYDSTSSPDLDYFAFNLVADGTSDYLLAVSIAYGCSFTGSPGAGKPLLDLVNPSDTRIAGLSGGQNYNTVSGSGTYGAKTELLLIPAASAPGGTNTYHLRLDDNHTSSFCMDYQLQVQLVHTVD